MLPDGKPVTATVKVDGELEVWEADVAAGVFVMINRNERERHVVPIADEVLAMLRKKGHQSARGAGELYAVRASNGRELPLSFEKSISQIKTRTKPDTPPHDQRHLRLAAFDLFELDGHQLWGAVPYADRFALLYSLFTNGEKFVKPVAGQAVTAEEPAPIGELWRKHVLEDNFEGLVLRMNGGIKVKPIHTIDLAVIAIQAGKGRHKGRMGALVCAYRDVNGRFVLAGKVGTGFTDEQREWWSTHVERVGGRFGTTKAEADIEYVVPTHVVECEAERFIKRQAKAWHWHARTQRWVRVGTQPSAIMQKPRFVRLRTDKTLSPYDLRLAQVPGWGSTVSRALVPEPSVNGKKFGKLLAAARPDLERFGSKLHVSANDFEDVLQDTYIKALRGWERLVDAGRFESGKGMPKPGTPLVTWLFTIFANEWTGLQRKRARQAKARRARGARQVSALAELRARGRELPRPNPKRKRPARRRKVAS